MSRHFQSWLLRIIWQCRFQFCSSVTGKEVEVERNCLIAFPSFSYQHCCTLVLVFFFSAVDLFAGQFGFFGGTKGDFSNTPKSLKWANRKYWTLEICQARPEFGKHLEEGAKLGSKIGCWLFKKAKGLVPLHAVMNIGKKWLLKCHPATFVKVVYRRTMEKEGNSWIRRLYYAWSQFQWIMGKWSDYRAWLTSKLRLLTEGTTF